MKYKEVKTLPTKGLTKVLINANSFLNGAKYFAEDDSQIYFVFQTFLKCFDASKMQNGIVRAWKSKDLSEESIKLPITRKTRLFLVPLF